MSNINAHTSDIPRDLPIYITMSLRRETETETLLVSMLDMRKREKKNGLRKKKKRHHKSIKIQTKCFIVILHISTTTRQWKTGSYSLQKHFQRR